MSSVLDILQQCGWTSNQAQALVELIGEGKPWGEDGRGSTWRQERLWNWCSAHSKKDPTSLGGQLVFLTADIRNLHGGLYRDMCDTDETKRSVDDIRKAIQPYFDKLAEGREP